MYLKFLMHTDFWFKTQSFPCQQPARDSEVMLQKKWTFLSSSKTEKFHVFWGVILTFLTAAE